ncbi:MAG: stage III sporulation protein AE [Oscillospiraceae bacterium]|jgi:stage III sporulation protein AE|nr:stage III sporulation protein AE [Oscillospiraceae bacterium]
MKRFSTLLVILLLFIPLLPYARAVDVVAEQSDALGTDELSRALPDEAGDILGNLSVTDAMDAERGIEHLVSGVVSRLRGIFTGALRSAAAVVLAAMLSGLFAAAFPERNGNYATLAAVLAVSAISLASVNTFIGMSVGVLDDLETFSKMLLPTLTAAATASGALTSAGIRYAATVLFLDVLMSLMRSVIMPLIYAFAALSVAEAAVGGDALAGAASLVKWLSKVLLSGFVLAFVAYVSLTGVIASAADAVAVRAAKVTISTVLPVVGSILADAADTVLSGAALLRNAVGVFGLLAVAAVCAVPFLKLGAHYLLFKAAGGLSGAVADKRITALVNAFGAAFGMTLAMTGVAAMMLFVSIVATIRVAA